MKIRRGFVSNSSTSSFLIFGVFLEDSELEEYFGIKRDEDDELDYDQIDQLVSDLNMEYHCPEGYDGYYIGDSLRECREDQTMGDFKKEVKERLLAKTIKKIPDEKFALYEEAYYS